MVKELKTKLLKFPKINFQYLIFDVEGLSPYMPNKPPEDFSKSPEKNPDPETEALKQVYTDENGNLVIPSRQFQMSIVAAARFVRGLNMTKIRGTYLVQNEDGSDVVEMLGNKDYRVWSRLTGTSKGKPMIAHNAVFEDWRCTFAVRYDAESLDTETLVQLVQKAGECCGIGGYRPNLGGSYGRFKALEIKVHQI